MAVMYSQLLVFCRLSVDIQHVTAVVLKLQASLSLSILAVWGRFRKVIDGTNTLIFQLGVPVGCMVKYLWKCNHFQVKCNEKWGLCVVTGGNRRWSLLLLDSALFVSCRLFVVLSHTVMPNT